MGAYEGGGALFSLGSQGGLRDSGARPLGDPAGGLCPWSMGQTTLHPMYVL